MNDDQLRRVSELPPHIVHVLSQIRQKYGHKADSLLGMDDEEKRRAANLWANKLAAFPRAAVNEAWHRCRESFPKMPPTLDQFHWMCRRVVEGASRRSDDHATRPETADIETVVPIGGVPAHKLATEELARRRAVVRSEPDIARKHLGELRQFLADKRLDQNAEEDD